MIAVRLAQLGIQLPASGAPVANYVPFTKRNGLVFLSGQLPLKDGLLTHTGRLGADLTLLQGQEAARQCAINLLANLRLACDGDLDRVEACLKVTGFVSSAETFHEQAAIVNGCSDLIVDIFGEVGRHARSAVGVNVLPLGAPVEIDAIFAITQD